MMSSGAPRIACSILLGFGLTLSSYVSAQTSPHPDSFALLASGPEDSETQLATEMVSLLPQESRPRVRIERGDAGFNAIVQLLSDPKIGAAFISTDALAYAKDVELGGRLEERLALIARLAPQEVHILAGRHITKIEDLAGQKVAVGPSGSSSAITAASLFAALKIEIEALPIEATRALDLLKRNEIAALVGVGGKPLPYLASMDEENLHLLAVPFGEELQAVYLPTRLEHDDYPGLIDGNADVPTIATGLALLAAVDKGDTARGAYKAWLEVLVGNFFTGLAELRVGDHHQKWRDVNLAASIPGLPRAGAAEAWLGLQSQPVAEAGPAEVRLTATEPQVPTSASISEDQREALFQEFIEWRRARQH
jgi:uncharacterized protein